MWVSVALVFVFRLSLQNWLKTWFYRLHCILQFIKDRKEVNPSICILWFLTAAQTVNTSWNHTKTAPLAIVQSLSRIHLFATPRNVAHQDPLSMGFSRQEYWSGFSFPTPGDLPDLGIEPVSSAFSGIFFTTVPQYCIVYLKVVKKVYFKCSYHTKEVLIIWYDEGIN